METYINPELLAKGEDVKENIFMSDTNNIILTNNINESIDSRHQGEVLYSVRGELCRFTRAPGVDKILLGMWIWIEI